MSLTKLRLFVSSPGDVAEERVIAARVLDRLAADFAPVAQIEPVFWEHEPLLATESFQLQIARPSETDIVVTILWSRLGTRLPPDIRRPDGSPYESGTEFEILSRDRLYAHVRLADGTEGYVKAAYVVYEPPAKLIVNQAQAEAERLTTELEEAKAAFAEPAAVIDALKSEAATLESELDAARTRVEALEEANTGYQSRAERYRYSLPYKWVGGAIGVCLIAGFLAGLWWVDHRSRKRHGGIRIY